MRKMTDTMKSKSQTLKAVFGGFLFVVITSLYTFVEQKFTYRHLVNKIWGFREQILEPTSLT